MRRRLCDIASIVGVCLCLCISLCALALLTAYVRGV